MIDFVSSQISNCNDCLILSSAPSSSAEDYMGMIHELLGFRNSRIRRNPWWRKSPCHAVLTCVSILQGSSQQLDWAHGIRSHITDRMKECFGVRKVDFCSHHIVLPTIGLI